MYDLHTYLQTLPLVKIFLWFLLRVLIRLSACFVKNIYWSNNTPSHNFDFSLHCFTLPIKKIIHGLWTPNEAFFHHNPKLLADNFCGIWGMYFWPIWYCESPVHVFHESTMVDHYFYKKTKPLYPNPKYLFGIGIWICAEKNWEFSHHVSVVRGKKGSFKKAPTSKATKYLYVLYFFEIPYGYWGMESSC